VKLTRTSTSLPAPESPIPARDFYVVGIGASAGGLGALRTFFSHMPPDTGFACVVVTHLSPSHESLLAPLLQPYSPMPVEQVRSTVPLEPGRVYVIPPNANLDAIDTHLRLSELEYRRSERAPIDHFMRTLATTHDGKSVGIVLTGAGSDGTLGVRLIKQSGGLTMAQDPREAEYDSMPRNAIATGMVDLVLPLAAMPGELVRFCATQPQLAADGSGELDDGQNALLDLILREVKARTGGDLSVYTRQALLPRVRHRMQVRHVDTLESYVAIVRGRPAEAEALRSDVLLSVTEFFRDPRLFEALASHTLPYLFDRLDQGPFRAWSIGCSTGEEAYSLAMLAFEEAERRSAPPSVRVFASDLSEDMLEQAREGVYPHEVAASIDPARLERFFVAEAGRYSVRIEVRNAVVFASHDLFKDPPYAHLDLIVCRNLLGDLHPEIRRGVINLFHYALRPDGVLVVGDRDDLDDVPSFERASADQQIYRRRPGPAQLTDVPLPTTPSPPATLRSPRSRAGWPPRDLLARVHRQALAPYTPSSLLVDRSDQIVHYAPGAATYLEIPGGTFTHSLVRLIPQPLRSPLMSALGNARRTGLPQVSDTVTVATDAGLRRIRMRADPVQSELYEGDLVLIVFEEVGVRDASGELTPHKTHPVDTIARLEMELARANERLHVLTEAARGDREPDRSRALSPHEESALAEIVEELESSKEELQALNEELTTVDAENRSRLDDLQQLSSDLQNLLASTGMATIFLDRQLQIVRFTPQAVELFHIRDDDVGRALSDLSTPLIYNELDADAQRVLASVAPVEREVPERDGRWFLVRLYPYRTLKAIGGIVMTLLDVTVRKRAELSLRDMDRRKDEFLAVLAHELRNPLAPISAGVEVLKQAGHEPVTVAKVAAMMERQARQLVRLVDDLLDAARIAGGRLQLRQSPIELSIAVRDAVAAVTPLFERARHTLTVQIGDEPLLVQADGARLTQVIANTLTNAANYTPPQGRIDVSVTRDGQSALITVRDNGQGMSADVLKHLFDMYFQGPSGGARNRGLGIGLAIAKQLMEMHGGNIVATSAGPGQGSTFTLSLPLLQDVMPAAAGEGRARPHHVSQRVLVVDDNADAAQSLSMLLLTLDGIRVRTALSGPEALEAGDAFHPHLVLLDLGMPGMDGYEAARLIRQEPWGRTVLLAAVTGWGQSEHRLRAASAGFDRHLTKPVVLETLEELLATLDERTAGGSAV
jgi:two-component system CheB/CheR fusion protein